MEKEPYDGEERRTSDRRAEGNDFQAYRENVLTVRDLLYRMRGWLIGTCLFVFVSLVLFLYQGSIVRSQAQEIKASTDQRVALGQQNNDLLKQVQELTRQLNDCLTPSGKCAQRSAANSQNLSTAIAYCAATLPKTATVDETLVCVVDVLKGKESHG